MKKILSIMLAFLLIFSCFAVTAFAEDFAISENIQEFEEVEDFDIFSQRAPKAKFSENYKKLYIDGEPYSRIDASKLITDVGYTLLVDEEYNDDYYTGNSIYIDLTAEQKQEIDTLNFGRNYHRNIYSVTINFKDGSTLAVTFLKDTFLEEYNQVISGNAEQLEIDFLYPDGNIITVNKNQLMGEKVTLSRNELVDFYDVYDVAAKSSDGSIIATVGLLIAIGDDFYYANYNDGYTLEEFWSDTDTAIGSLANQPIYRITDEAVLESIEEALISYYEDDYGILYNDNATETISAVFFILVFALVPFVIFVIFLIKAIRGKGIYKKLYATISALCIAEIIVFVILAIIIAPNVQESELSLTTSNGGEFVILNTDFTDEEVCMLKEAIYCGDGDCSDGCTIGFFFRDESCTTDYAMEKLGLGVPDGIFEGRSRYVASYSENIVLSETIYENGVIVEYQVIGVA